MLKAAAFQGDDSVWLPSGEAAVSMRTEGAVSANVTFFYFLSCLLCIDINGLSAHIKDLNHSASTLEDIHPWHKTSKIDKCQIMTVSRSLVLELNY